MITTKGKNSMTTTHIYENYSDLVLPVLWALAIVVNGFGLWLMLAAM